MKFCLYGVMLSFVYHSALSRLISYDWAREDYTYFYLIPLVIVLIIWERRAVLASLPSTPSWFGLLPLVLGLLLNWLGELGGEFFTLYVSLWFVIVGLLWMHLGWKKVKAMGFALFVFLTMFPLPGFINAKVLMSLRLISSQLGVGILQLFGMSAYHEGNIIDLGFTQLQVVDACSGLRGMSYPCLS